jgi:2-polyprenyl-3-methyl-5-hydroxy-6-metoxy-1,4-benzoquinol methylase
MSPLTGKLRYLGRSALKLLRGQGKACPSCGGLESQVLDRKAWVLAFRRCAGCQLLFRAPTTSAVENEAFYQTAYRQGFTTNLPSEQELQRLLESRFEGHDKNYAGYIAVLRALGVSQGARVFDFGCSWGYGSWQLAQAGFAVEAFEISRPRAEFARTRLGVELRQPEALPEGGYDVFFSAHVIEHVPSVAAMLELGLRLLKPGGLFVCFTPNGSLSFRRRNPQAWHLMWGEAHPQLLDEEFLTRRCAGLPLLLTSAPLHQPERPHPLAKIAAWERRAQPVVATLDEVELMFAAQKPPLSF